MAEEGGGGGSGSGTAVKGSSKKPSWDGGSVPATLDPKNLGTKFLSDADRVYAKGPVVNPIKDFVPYSDSTKGMISQGLGNNDALRSGRIGDIARGGVNIGPDYTKGIMGDVASGKYLGKGNPFLNAEIERTRDNVSNEINSTFASNGRFGADIHAEGLGKGLADSENSARFNQYNTDYGNMTQALGLQGGQANNNLDRQIQASGMLDDSTAQALGYSGLLDSKLEEKKLSDQNAWDDKNNANFNHLAKYLGLLRGGDSANETNKPLSFWDILGTIGQTAGSFL
jgi:hypothetical protein